jgi:hypothetical protein
MKDIKIEKKELVSENSRKASMSFILPRPELRWFPEIKALSKIPAVACFKIVSPFFLVYSRPASPAIVVAQPAATKHWYYGQKNIPATANRITTK